MGHNCAMDRTGTYDFQKLAAPPGICTVPTYKVDLDLPAEERWSEVIANNLQEIHGARTLIKQELKDLLGPFVNGLIDLLGGTVGSIANQFVLLGKEVSGFAKATGLALVEVLILQFMYEAASCCTSIVINGPNGYPVHIRTMDWEFDFLKALTIEVQFFKGGKPLFTTTTWPGYLGVLTGMKPNAFSVSVNFRIKGDSYLVNAGKALTRSWPIGFLVRDVLETDSTYEQAVGHLSGSGLIAPVY